MNKLNITSKLTPTERKVIIAEAVFVIGVFAYLFFATAPNQIFPLQGMVIVEPDFVFEIENGESILVSIDENFTNPIRLEEGDEIVLPPGEYFWKVIGGYRESEVKSFIIQSQVGLNIKERDENYELENSGNVDMNVTRENEFGISSMTINIGETEDVEKDNSSYEGRQI